MKDEISLMEKITSAMGGNTGNDITDYMPTSEYDQDIHQYSHVNCKERECNLSPRSAVMTDPALVSSHKSSRIELFDERLSLHNQSHYQHDIVQFIPPGYSSSRTFEASIYPEKSIDSQENPDSFMTSRGANCMNGEQYGVFQNIQCHETCCLQNLISSQQKSHITDSDGMNGHSTRERNAIDNPNHYTMNTSVDQSNHFPDHLYDQSSVGTADHSIYPQASTTPIPVQAIAASSSTTPMNAQPPPSSSQKAVHHIYFWQYNSQCKGPKALQLVANTRRPSSPPVTSSNSSSSPRKQASTYYPLIATSSSTIHSPYPLASFDDPVRQRVDLVHCSKLRRGDGNDVAPNLTRLRSMGREMAILTRRLTEQTDLIVSRSSSSTASSGVVARHAFANYAIGNYRLVERAKREKNKLASKICRLKKKAFHEANKIKYAGLEVEYYELDDIINGLRSMISSEMNARSDSFKHSNTAFGCYNQGWYQPLTSTTLEPNNSQYNPSISHALNSVDPSTVGCYPDTFESWSSRRHQDPITEVKNTEYPGYYTNQSNARFEQSNEKNYNAISLSSRAETLYTSRRSIYAAGRLDAFVDQVLRLVESTSSNFNHPMLTKLIRNNQSGRFQPTTPSSSTNDSIGYCQLIHQSDSPGGYQQLVQQSCRPSDRTESNYYQIGPTPHPSAHSNSTS